MEPNKNGRHHVTWKSDDGDADNSDDHGHRENSERDRSTSDPARPRNLFFARMQTEILNGGNYSSGFKNSEFENEYKCIGKLFKSKLLSVILGPFWGVVLPLLRQQNLTSMFLSTQACLDYYKATSHGTNNKNFIHISLISIITLRWIQLATLRDKKSDWFNLCSCYIQWNFMRLGTMKLESLDSLRLCREFTNLQIVPFFLGPIQPPKAVSEAIEMTGMGSNLCLVIDA